MEQKLLTTPLITTRRHQIGPPTAVVIVKHNLARKIVLVGDVKVFNMFSEVLF